MKEIKKPLLAGIISKNILSKLQSGTFYDLHHKIQMCDVLEIRYDLFENIDEWASLASQVSTLNPKAKIIGTIRLECDGGLFKTPMMEERLKLWQLILEADRVPDWLDLEEQALVYADDFMRMAKKAKSKVFISKHDFNQIPSMESLSLLQTHARELKVKGIKVAAMSQNQKDYLPLYGFLKEISDFHLKSVFAMGLSGVSTRIWSLKHGANLTYASFIEELPTLSLLPVELMRKAIDSLHTYQSEDELAANLLMNPSVS